jgi:hypothetical protein
VGYLGNALPVNGIGILSEWLSFSYAHEYLPGSSRFSLRPHIALTWPDLASVRRRPSNSRPMMGAVGPAVQAHSTWFTDSLLFGAMGTVTDLTVPGVRLGLARSLPAQRLAYLTPQLPREPDCQTRICFR